MFECRLRRRLVTDPPGAGEKHSKNAVSECRLRQRVVTDPPGLALHATADESEGNMEQQSDHKLITPSGMGLLVCGAGSHPSLHLGVVRRMCQRE